MGKRKSTLLVKFIALFMIFAVVLCVLISTVSYVNLRTSMLRVYGEYATGTARMAVEILDADDLVRYAETLEMDDKYRETHDALLDIRNTMQVEFMYVQMPLDDDTVMYIFEAYELDLVSEDQIPLGFLDEYNDNFKTAKQAMATGEATAELEITNTHYGYLASAYVPIKNAEGVPIAYVGVDMDMNDLLANLRTYLIFIILSTVLLVAACFALMLWLVRRTMLRPLARIVGKTQEFVRGGIEDEGFAPLEITTNDEMATLAVSLNQMFEELRSYTVRLAEEAASRQRMADDMQTARNIQTSLLPKRFPPYLDYTDVEIYASLRPAQQISNDFYDCFPVDRDHIAFVIADISGTGISAALFMTVVHTLVKNRAVSGYSPREVFESMNKQLCAGNEQRMSAKVFLGIYNARNNVLSYVNAGHPAPILKRIDGSTSWLPVEQGVDLGVDENAEYVTQAERMEPGDSLLLYTRGVIDAVNTEGTVFSADTLIQLVRKINMRALVPQQVVEAIDTAVGGFARGAHQQTDVALMLMRRL